MIQEEARGRNNLRSFPIVYSDSTDQGAVYICLKANVLTNYLSSTHNAFCGLGRFMFELLIKFHNSMRRPMFSITQQVVRK